jgi:hypothetical protein
VSGLQQVQAIAAEVPSEAADLESLDTPGVHRPGHLLRVSGDGCPVRDVSELLQDAADRQAAALPSPGTARSRCWSTADFMAFGQCNAAQNKRSARLRSSRANSNHDPMSNAHVCP